MKSSRMRAKTNSAKTAAKLLVAVTGKASPAKAAERRWVQGRSSPPRSTQLHASLRLIVVAIVGSLAIGGCQAESALVGPTWQWTASQETVPAHLSVTPDPENYTIEFLDDGTVEVTADCNNMGGSYTVAEPDELTITLVTTTMAYCGDESQDAIFIDFLGRVASYAIADTDLTLDFADDAGP
jgi:heat shock protein HslJ